MRQLFYDAGYIIALLNKRDDHHEAAMKAANDAGDHAVLVTEMVLVETLNSLGSKGEHLRRQVAEVVETIRAADGTTVVPQTPEQFQSALAMFKERHDKEWSVTDCASFLAMQEHAVHEAMTPDRHFVQNGYKALLLPDGK